MKAGKFYAKYRPVADKCKEILKSLSITGYGGASDIIKIQLENICKAIEYNFPYGWDWRAEYLKNHPELDSTLNCGYTVRGGENGEPYEVELDIPYGMISKDGTILAGSSSQKTDKNILIELQKAMDAEVPGVVINRDKFIENEDSITVWYEVPEGEGTGLKAKEAADVMTGVLEELAGNYSTGDDSLNTSKESELDTTRSEIELDHEFICKSPYELVAILESELANLGRDVTIKECYRPNANTVGFTYSINDGSSPEEVDELIEEFTRGYDRLYGKSSSFNSSKHPITQEEFQFKLNSAIRNARVEHTDTGTYVVRGDSDRFGDDVILYESYREDEAQDYLNRVEAANNAEESGNKMRDDAQRYRGYLITGTERSGFVALSPYGRYCSKVFKTIDEARTYIDADLEDSEPVEHEDFDLDSSNVYEKAELNLESIATAMTTAIKDDPDTPVVLVNTDSGLQAFIAPAGYEDNRLVVDGNIADAEVYVTLFNGYKAIQVDGHYDKKMKGSDVVNYVQSYMDRLSKKSR